LTYSRDINRLYVDNYMIIPVKRRKPRFEGEYTRPPVILGGLIFFHHWQDFQNNLSNKINGKRHGRRLV
jgi:hypothetical protein